MAACKRTREREKIRARIVETVRAGYTAHVRAIRPVRLFLSAL